MRLKKRRTKTDMIILNNLYRKVQRSFVRLAKNKRNYFILNSSPNDKSLENDIFKIVNKFLKIK